MGIVLVVVVIVTVLVVLLGSGAAKQPTRPPIRPPQRPQPGPVARAEPDRAARAEQERQERERRERELREQGRRERERRDAQALHSELVALEAAARALPDGSPGGPVLTAGLRLAVQDRAAETVAAGLADPFPAPVPLAADGYAARPVETFLENLQRNAVAVAGVEQLTVSAFAAAAADPAVAPDVLVALANAPDHVAAAADGLVTYLQDPQATVDVAHAVGAALRHAGGSILPDFTHGMVDPGLAGRLVKAVATQSGVPATVAAWMGKQALSGLKDLAEQAGQTAEIAGAVANLEQAADAVAGALGLDAAFGSHIPVLTAAVSGVREIRLLHEGRTTAAVAARNVALDVGGTGLGATIGGLVGGLAGSVVPVVGNTAGAVAGAGVGGAVGRFVSNKVKGRDLRRAEEELDQVQEAYPARMRGAAVRLHGVVVEQVRAADAAFHASVGPVPRLAERHGAPLRSVCGEFRAAAVAHLDEIDDAVARARRWAANGYIPAPDLPHTVAAVAATRSAVAALDGNRSVAPLLALCTLAHAAPPAPEDGRLGAAYRTAAARATQRLDRLAAVHAAEVRDWTARTSARFAERTDALGTALTPALRTYRDRATTATAELGAATEQVRVERDRLGR